jgi:hypothetical protein
MKSRVTLVLALAVALTRPCGAAEPAEKDFVEQVRESIARGVAFLKQRQKVEGDRGHWEDDVELKREGGWTALAVLALLTAGEKPDDPVVRRGLRWLDGFKATDTYVVGLQTMALAEADPERYLGRIQDNADWLVKARVIVNGEFRGWGYKTGDRLADNSNTQYALLGLNAAKAAKAKIDPEVWESIQKFYIQTQFPDGGWYYRREGRPESTLTMTTAGLCGLLIAGTQLSEAREKLGPDGSAANCGEYAENQATGKALGYVAKNFEIGTYKHYLFYNVYGIERAGRLSGRRWFGDHDWYREGCDYLVKNQHDNGSWYLRGVGFDRWPVVSTSFAVLFLSKGRTPVLISKLVHGQGENPPPDWNRKHNDMRNLVDYASGEVFKRVPLAWQVFNTRQTGRNEPDALAAELLQSPVAYLSGHNRPVLTGTEKEMLKKYLEQGGFLLAEACCGSEGFDRGFRELIAELFEKDGLKLQPLRADHPVWSAHALVSPREFPLEGLEFGCKTVVIYSPKPISGYWEANQQKDGRGRTAFRLAGNVIAYATGMEPPQPKGFKVEVYANTAETKVPRGALKVAQLKHGNDRHSTAGVMRNLMQHLRKSARLDVSLQTQDFAPDDKDLLNYRFVYMHGRGEFDIDHVEVLRSSLETGGLLFADACCGREAFDRSFRKFAEKLFPGKKLEPIPVGDELYSKELNGTAITSVRCRRERGQAGYQDVAPYLEGIKVGDRWAVIYSKYDIGCALEKHQSSDCLGHDHASALRLASAVVFYYLQR